MKHITDGKYAPEAPYSKSFKWPPSAAVCSSGPSLYKPILLFCHLIFLQLKGALRNPWLATAFWLHLFYFDIWRQASWEMPHRGNLPSTGAVTGGTHVAVNDPSDRRDRDPHLSPGTRLFFFFGYYIQNVKSDRVLQLLANYYRWGCCCKFCLFHVTLNKSIEKMYFANIILGEWSESECKNERSSICYIAACLKTIQLPVLIQAGRCQNAWVSSSHAQTVCFLAQYACVYLIQDLEIHSVNAFSPWSRIMVKSCLK